MSFNQFLNQLIGLWIAVVVAVDLRPDEWGRTVDHFRIWLCDHCFNKPVTKVVGCRGHFEVIHQNESLMIRDHLKRGNAYFTRIFMSIAASIDGGAVNFYSFLDDTNARIQQRVQNESGTISRIE